MAEWKIHYWPYFKRGSTEKPCGRAEFIRIIFEEAAVPYEESKDDEMDNMIQTFKDGKPLEGWPVFAVPYIENKKTGFRLGQTPVVCEYLGQQFGLYPKTDEDIHKARQVTATVHDFIADGRLAFHGKDFQASYFTQEEETKPYIEKFIARRLPKWLKYFEETLKCTDTGFVVGNSLTYADLGLLHVLRATESQFPEPWKNNSNIPLLKAFKERMEGRERLAAYYKSDRARKFEGNSMM